MPHTISEEQFKQYLENKLGNHYQRALTVFKNYGDKLSWDIVNVLLHAADKQKTSEVLSILEKHWETHLQFQHPEIRGTVSGLGGNPTQAMFIFICQDILKLQPNPQ